MTRERHVYESDNKRRLDRMKRWLDRAKLADKDPYLKKRDKGAMRFVFYWIAFEAAFGTQEKKSGERKSDKQLMERFIKKAFGKDKPKFNQLLDRKEEVYRNSVKLLKLRVTHEGFWKKPSSMTTHGEWKNLFDKEIKEFPDQNSFDQLCVIFSRLRVVRNQIFHGASSVENSKGISQVETGLKILSAVIPAFKEVMEGNKKNTDWKPVPYPRVDKHDHPTWEEG